MGKGKGCRGTFVKRVPNGAFILFSVLSSVSFSMGVGEFWESDW